jgi:hypothetical protein
MVAMAGAAQAAQAAHKHPACIRLFADRAGDAILNPMTDPVANPHDAFFKHYLS